MTPDEILSRVEASRKFSVQVGAATYDLLLPTDLDLRMASSRALRGDGAVDVPRAQFEFVAGAVLGWSGVTLDDLSPGLADVPGEPLPFDAVLVRPLLASRLDICDALAVEIYQRRDARAAALKNSPSASRLN